MTDTNEVRETKIGRDIRWYFFKMILLSELDFEPRQRKLIERIKNPNAYHWSWGGRDYIYEATDAVELTFGEDRHYIAFYINREPKIAHGRRVDRQTHTSQEDTVLVRQMFDSAIGIYDLRTCVLALQATPPFSPRKATTRAIQALFGDHDPRFAESWETDLHCEAMREALTAEQAFDELGNPRAIRIAAVRSNPIAGDDVLSSIADKVNAHKLSFVAENSADGVDASQGSWLRRSLRNLVERGYLRKAVATWKDGKKVDYADNEELTQTTSGLERTGDNALVPLGEQAPRLFNDLVINEVYSDNSDEQ